MRLRRIWFILKKCVIVVVAASALVALNKQQKLKPVFIIESFIALYKTKFIWVEKEKTTDTIKASLRK